MNIDLSNRVALVTGATGELGRVIAFTLARCGADVAVHFFKNKEGTEKLCSEITSMNVRAFPVQADVGSREEIVHEQLGAPAIIVNNAVSQSHGCPFSNRRPRIMRASSAHASCTTSSWRKHLCRP